MPVAKKRKAKPKTSLGLAGLPDVEAMDAYVAATPRVEQLAALEKAQTIARTAWETATEAAMIRRCHRALEASPLCADAFNTLGFHMPMGKRQLAIYERALAAGERALGPEGFEEYDGEFWGWLETRPYMRARANVAMALELADRNEEAIGHYRAMLVLNPGDNQGIRYLLLAVLMRMPDKAEVHALLAERPDESSLQFNMTRALLAYQEGRQDSGEARAAAAAALKRNKHILPILTGKEQAQDSGFPGIMVGGPDEVSDYLSHGGGAWFATKGAIQWLQEVASQLPG